MRDQSAACASTESALKEGEAWGRERGSEHAELGASRLVTCTHVMVQQTLAFIHSFLCPFICSVLGFGASVLSLTQFQAPGR